MHAAELPAACDNCRTPLHGAYCHACGQHAANPLRSFHHAVEDVFESFWHLDGRVFRTLRELFAPGRVACNYLDGQRARYVPPLRLFVVLTVLTFFVGQLAVGLGDDPAGARPRQAGSAVQLGTGSSEFSNARSEADVQRVLARELANLRTAREAVSYVPGASRGLDTAEQQLRTAAQQRIDSLRAAAGRGSAVPGSGAVPADGGGASMGGDAAAVSAATRKDRTGDADNNAAQFGMPAFVRKISGGRLRHPDRTWHEHDNPIEIGWLPAFVNRWLNHRLANAERNIERIDEAGESMLAGLALAAVPSALFVLVPVFALLLRVIYLRSARGYLEHLVVALYSHAFMLLMLLAGFVLAITGALLPGAAADRGVGFALAVLWLSVPAYLLVMQKRVYGQRWLVTAGKYLLLGGAYFMLVLAAVVYTVFAGLTSGS